jgi:predicted nuclease with TOPRIM domain
MSFNVLEEYKQHNDFLIELNKEKNAELNELRETVKRHGETYSYLQAKVERYEEALRYIAGENRTVYADTIEEARDSAITALDDDEWEGE